MLSLLNTTFTNTLRQGFTLIGSLLSKLRARSTYFENQAGTKVILQEIDSAELLEKASIITTPTAYSDGVLHSVKPSESPYADFTFTRNTIATRVNASGLIESAANNLPRIDYTGGGCGSWLLEPQRINLIPRSNEFNFWNNLQNKLTITSNSITSPDGTVNGTKLTQAVSSSNARLRYSGILTIGTEYTFSVYAKKGNHDKLIMNISGVSTTFTLTDDWVRYEITETAPNNTFVDVGITNAVVGDFIYIYGAQAEEASYATSYIPTSGSAVTRAVDSATDAGSSDLISSTEGVLYAEFSSLTNEDSTYRVIALSNGNPWEFVFVGFTNINSIYAYVGSQSIAYFTPTNATDFHKVAIKYEDNNCKLFVNGVQVGTTNTTATVPSGLDRLNFDGGIGDIKFNGNVKCIAVFQEALTDAELTCLTTPNISRIFNDRVLWDGGIIESLECIESVEFRFTDYYSRVISNGGTIESLECVSL